jgi:ribosome maturation factor RimP
VRTREAIEGRRNFTGTLAEADDDAVLVAAEGAPVRIPLAGIKRSNLIGELEIR